MKLITFLALPSLALAASWVKLFQGRKLRKGQAAIDAQDIDACVAHASKFIKKPVGKERAIERAMDHCALSKKVEDKNFVCPHYRELLEGAFRRKATTDVYTAKSFCSVAELYVEALEGAGNIPNMGAGKGAEFKLSKDCKPIVLASIAPAKQIPASTAPDFWYALCANQDCAHFLPSRTRWCTDNHGPTHSSLVCEAVRDFTKDAVDVFGPGELDADDVCETYTEFVQDTVILLDAYGHVVHGRHHNVPIPGDKPRALDSARMKHDAKAHGLRDASGTPVGEAEDTMDVDEAEVEGTLDAEGIPVHKVSQEADFWNLKTKEDQERYFFGSLIYLAAGILMIFLLSKSREHYHPATQYGNRASGQTDFTYSVFACFATPKTCIFGCCCPCVLWGDTNERLKLDSYLKPAIMFVILAVLSGYTKGLTGLLLLVFGIMTRQKVRGATGLEKGGKTLITDTLSWCCCPILSIIQESREASVQ
jgi:Cys-rich protein (TIGR01571 family)